MRRYNLWLLSAFIIPVLLIGLFNFTVDPFDLFEAPKIPGINENKPSIVNHTRLYKAFNSKNKNANTLILGPSTSELAIDPNSQYFINKPVYNLSFSAANSYEVYRYLQHATANHPPKEVLIFLNFYMFDAHRPTQTDFNETILSVDKDNQSNLAPINFYLNSLFSQSSVGESINCIKQQNAVPFLLDNGQRTSAFVKDSYDKLSTAEYFSFTENYWKRNLVQPSNEKDFFYSSKNDHSTLEDIKNIVEFCQKQKIQLTFIIPPVHVRMLEVYKNLGLMTPFLQSKKQLTLLLKDTHFILWDFSDINSYTSEKISEKKNQRLKWFGDDIHFYVVTGDRILEKVYTGKSSLPGYKLTQENVDRINSRFLVKLKQWELNNPTDVVQIASNLART